MEGPLVSVIMAVRNGERFLDAAIHSILEQDYRPYEILLVDGRSEDGTARIAGSYPQVRRILQDGTGVADAYNQGIAAARGALIAFLSHDDLWDPRKLENQVRFMLEHPGISFSTTWIRFFLEPGSSPGPGFRTEWLEKDHASRVVETLLAHKRVFEAIGGFRTGLLTAEDVDWFARAQDAGIPNAIIPKVLTLRRIHETNNSLVSQENTRNLFEALRASILRKRAAHPPGGEGS